jgi:osmotically-inducible protein OsmY
MDTLFKRLATIMIALAVASLMGCAGSQTRESTGEYIDDSAITTKVKAKFVEDKAVGALDIHVETFKGVVQLSGFAKSDAERRRATELARSVPGVKEVKDDIELRSS